MVEASEGAACQLMHKKLSGCNLGNCLWALCLLFYSFAELPPLSLSNLYLLFQAGEFLLTGRICSSGIRTKASSFLEKLREQCYKQYTQLQPSHIFKGSGTAGL